MRCSIPFLVLCSFHLTKCSCFPHSNYLPERRTIEPPHYPPSFRHHDPNHPLSTLSDTRSLSPRNTNLTTAANGKITFQDLSFLIPSSAHIALLRTIFLEIRSAVTTALDSAHDSISETASLSFRYGFYTFTIISLQRIAGWRFLLQYAIDIIDDVMLAMYPATWSLLFHVPMGFVFWVAGVFDGSFFDQLSRKPKPKPAPWIA